MVVIPLKMYAGIDVFILLSIPGFIIAGNLMNQGGLTDKIIDFCNHLLGHVRGEIILCNISASMLFAGISGTAISDTASLGAVMIPAMKKEGYDSDFFMCYYSRFLNSGPHYSSQFTNDHRGYFKWSVSRKIVFGGGYSRFVIRTGLNAGCLFCGQKKELS